MPHTQTSDTAVVARQQPPPAPKPISDRVVNAPPLLFERAPRPTAPPDFLSMVQKGGGSPAFAERLWNEGITQEDAVHALTLAMYSPSIEDFASARLLVEILSWSRIDGRVSPKRVRHGFANLKNAVVVRPDGVVARVGDGRALESRTLALREGRLEAGGLPVGALYGLRSGVFYQTQNGRMGAVAGELCLQHDVANSLLDGAEMVIVETLRGAAHLLKGLHNDPEATLTGLVHAVGSIPKQAVKLAFESPEALQRFANLPQQDQLQLSGKLVSGLILAIAGLGAGAEAAGATGAALKQATLRVGLAEMGAGRVLPFFSIEGVPALANAGAAIGRATAWNAPQPALRIRDGDLADPKIRFANEHHIGRTVNDPRIKGASVDDLTERLARVKDQPLNTQKVYAEMVKEYLEANMQHLPLQDVGKLYKALDGLERAATLKARAWVHQRFRTAIDKLGDVATPKARAAAEDIRRHADEAGLSVHELSRPRLSASPRSSLSAEAQKAMTQIEDGVRSVEVSSRAVAEEILSQFPELAQTQRWAKWKTKALMEDAFENTFHWDDVKGDGGRVVGHEANNPHGKLPHLQFEAKRLAAKTDVPEQHVFFSW